MTRTRDPVKLAAQREKNAVRMRERYRQLTPAEKEIVRAKERIRYKEKRAGQWVRWERQALRAARQRAKQRNLEFTLKRGDLICPRFCPVLGIEIFVGDPTKNNSPSLDRFDNSRGYTKENVRIISGRANKIKTNATVEELELVLLYAKYDL